MAKAKAKKAEAVQVEANDDYWEQPDVKAELDEIVAQIRQADAQTEGRTAEQLIAVLNDKKASRFAHQAAINELHQKPCLLRDELKKYVTKRQGSMVLLCHPFFNGGFDSRFAMIPHLQIDEKTAIYDKLIAKGKLKEAILMTDATLLVHRFVELSYKLSPKHYWETLGIVWTQQRGIFCNWDHFLELFRDTRADRKYVMSKEDRDALAKMPDQFPVYRGFVGRNGKGMSWTINREIAIWFAEYSHNRDPKQMKLRSGIVNKADVFAYLSNRNEAEIVVDPDKVKNQETIDLNHKLPKGGRPMPS